MSLMQQVEYARPGAFEEVSYEAMAITADPHLAERVRVYKVCCKVWPEYVVFEGGLRQVGFELELLGSHSADAGHLDPSCPLCRRVRSTLLAVAVDFVPSSIKSVRCEIDTHSDSITYDPGLGNRPFVTVSIRILHERNFDQPVDASETTCLKRIKEHLAKFGVRER